MGRDGVSINRRSINTASAWRPVRICYGVAYNRGENDGAAWPPSVAAWRRRGVTWRKRGGIASRGISAYRMLLFVPLTRTRLISVMSVGAHRFAIAIRAMPAARIAA